MILTVIGEYTRQCLAVLVARKINSDDVLHCLADFLVKHGMPGHIHSDNGPEFAAKTVETLLAGTGVRTLFIEPASPWENGYNQSFIGKLRDEVLNRQIFSL